MSLYGRTIIETDIAKIDTSNILEVLADALKTFNTNVKDIQYLYDYYKGKQDILSKTKDVRPEINHIVCENRAAEIVTFKTGYLVGEPIQYISDTNDDVTEAVNQLNTFMKYNSKATLDEELVEWMNIAGTSYIIALPSDDEECPFKLSVINPDRAFIIYSSSIFHEALAGVYVSEVGDDTVYTVYTNEWKYTVIDDAIKREPNPLGLIPIIEYPANNSRIGAFELVIDLLNEINNLDSSRMDSVDQFVQSLLVLYNAELGDDTTANTIRQAGLIALKSVNGMNADIKVISEELNQSQTQTLKDDLYDAVLTICSMPSRNGSDSGSNGIAVVYRDGWTAAETAAKVTEAMYKESDRKLRKVVFTILRTLGGVDLKVSQVEPHFTRRNYENIATKSQVLIAMLNNDKIDPKYAYTACGLFIDPEEAYAAGMKWYESRQAEQPNISNTGIEG